MGVLLLCGRDVALRPVHYMLRVVIVGKFYWEPLVIAFYNRLPVLRFGQMPRYRGFGAEFRRFGGHMAHDPHLSFSFHRHLPPTLFRVPSLPPTTSLYHSCSTPSTRACVAGLSVQWTPPKQSARTSSTSWPLSPAAATCAPSAAYAADSPLCRR